MHTDRAGQTAVIFLSRRSDVDDAGYAEAAAAMEAMAATQPGYRGIDSVRDAAGTGITISWWSDAAAALAWRRHAAHVPVRAQGRARWYDSYEVIVTSVDRNYGWTR